MRVSQIGVNSLLVTWTPSEGDDVTGYTVHYQQIDGGQNGSVTATDTSVIITGLIVGATFSISVSANSNTLPSITATGPNVTIQQGKGLQQQRDTMMFFLAFDPTHSIAKIRTVNE